MSRMWGYYYGFESHAQPLSLALLDPFYQSQRLTKSLVLTNCLQIHAPMTLGRNFSLTSKAPAAQEKTKANHINAIQTG